MSWHCFNGKPRRLIVIPRVITQYVREEHIGPYFDVDHGCSVFGALPPHYFNDEIPE